MHISVRPKPVYNVLFCLNLVKQKVKRGLLTWRASACVQPHNYLVLRAHYILALLRC